MFEIGQRIKCIDSRWGSATGTEFQLKHCPHLPVIGAVYTVRYIQQIHVTLVEGQCWFVRLVEITNPLNAVKDEPVFYAKHFVPVGGDIVTNIDFARELLENPNKVIKRDKKEIAFFRTKKGGRHERA